VRYFIPSLTNQQEQISNMLWTDLAMSNCNIVNWQGYCQTHQQSPRVHDMESGSIRPKRPASKRQPWELEVGTYSWSRDSAGQLAITVQQIKWSFEPMPTTF